MTSYFNSLPNELKENVLIFSNPSTVASLSQTCSSSNQFVKDNRKRFDKIFYPYQTIKFIFNDRKQFNNHDIIKQLNLSCIVNIDFFFEKNLYLTIKGNIRVNDGKYYFNNDIKVKVIYYYSSDIIEDEYIKYTLKLTVPFKNHKMNGIYFLTVEGGEDEPLGPENNFRQTNNVDKLLVIPYCNGIKHKIYIEIAYTEMLININNIVYMHEDDSIPTMTLQKLYNYFPLLNPDNINITNIENFAYNPRYYRLINVIKYEHEFVFTNVNEIKKLEKVSKIIEDTRNCDRINNIFYYAFSEFLPITDAYKIKLDGLYPDNISIFNYIIYFYNDSIDGPMVATFIYLKENVYYKPSIKNIRIDSHDAIIDNI